MNIENKKACQYCDTEISGRTDKRFCNNYCKSAFHYNENKNKESSLFKSIDAQLKMNRRILKEYNKEGKTTVRKAVLIKEGFNPKYFTHYWKNNKDKVYLFCYEFGFLSIKENNNEKYLLVHWQKYMG